MTDLRCKLLVIGAGPGGYVCAIRAGQLGVDTIIVERASLGGTCLNIGCIPSKALIHAADEFSKVAAAASASTHLGISASGASIDLKATIDWKDSIVDRLTTGVGALLKKAGVRVVKGNAEFLDGKTVEVEFEGNRQRIVAETVVIATGSEPVELPFLPFGGPVMSSTTALSRQTVPQQLVVVGGGYIGLEIGTVFRKLGASVTIVEAAPRILPQYDAELTKPLLQRLKTLGIDVKTECQARGLQSDGKGLVITLKDGEEQVLPADAVLVTVGRRPVTKGFGLEGLKLTMSGPFVEIDAMCRTSMRGVFAIGDITGEPMLAHRAIAQGEMVAEIVAGKKRIWDKVAIPAICFTDPELVTVGQSPDEARNAGIETRIGTFPFRGNGRAMTLERDDGFVRIVARADNHLVLGIQAVGQGVAELAAAFGLALEMGVRLEDIAATIHAHPSLGEAVQEAALSGLGHAIHF
jgi:dihydrolipoamide dehydrogenase